jgi:hypothetical protein
MDTRLLYKVHKWLAVFVGLLTLSWFVSGAVMAFPPSWRSLTPGLRTDIGVESRLPGAPEFNDASITPSVAIATVQSKVSTPVRVTSVALRRLPGRLAYDIETDRHGRHLVDAITGAAFTIDEAYARQILRRFLGENVALGAATLERWSIRIPIENGTGATAEVSKATGETTVTDPLNRAIRLITRMHEMGFLLAVIPDYVLQTVFLVMGAAGTVMTLAGLLILWAQFQRWRQRS